MATALSYPTISGVTTPPYLSALSEVANIQNTINFLYYGSTDAGTTPRTSLSTSSGIYGMLAQLQNQISSLQSGINVHENAKYATTTTITGTYSAGSADNSATPGTGINAYITFTATGAQSIDSGANLVLGDRVLVKNGTTLGAAGTTSSIANGIYVVQSDGIGGQATLTPTFSNGSATKVVLVRSTDANNTLAGDFAEGDFLYVSDGSTNANEAFMLTTSSATGGLPTGTIRIGTDTVTYNQFIGVGSYYIGTTTAQISSANQALTGISSLAMPGATSGTITLTPAATAGTTAITIPAVAGTLAINPTTTIGDVIYASATGTPGTLARLAGVTATAPGFLYSVGNGSANTSTAFSSSTGSGNVVLTTSPTFATSILGGASMDVFNTGSTTLNIGGAATTLSIGNTATAAQTVNMFTASTGASTYNIASGVTATATTKALNIGTGGGSGSTTNITMGSSIGGTFTINSPTLTLASTATLNMNGSSPTIATSSTGTASIFNTTAATVRLGGQATTMNLATGSFTTLRTINIGNAASGTGNSQTINIGVNSTTTANNNINIGGSTSSAITFTGTANIGKALLQTVTSTAGASTITFSSIPQTYKSLEVEYTVGTANTAATTLSIQFSGDTATNYTYAFQQYTGNASTNTSAPSSYANGFDQVAILVPMNHPENTAIGSFNIDNYASTSGSKIGRYDGYYNYISDAICYGTFAWKNRTTAVTSMTLTFNGTVTGQIVTAKLFGIN